MTKRNVNNPEFLMQILESTYNQWGKQVNLIQREMNKLQSLENTILVIELRLKDLGVEGFAKTT